MIEKKIITEIVIDLIMKSVKIELKDEVLFFSKYEYEKLLTGESIDDDEVSYRMEKKGPEKTYLLIKEDF